MTVRAMVDIETLDTVETALVLEIGVVKVDFEDSSREVYRCSPGRQEQLDAGRTISLDTLGFWTQQPEDARRLLRNGLTETPVKDCLDEISRFLDDAAEVWAKPPSFDLNILANLNRQFRPAGAGDLWYYRAPRDLRTLLAVYGDPGVQHNGTVHNALDDADFQMRQLIAILERIEAAFVVKPTTGLASDQEFVNGLDYFASEVNQTALAAGWWDEDRNDGEILALIHSEVSEMLEALRKPGPDPKLPAFQQIETEAADVLIRLLDFCAVRGYRLPEAALAKNAYNKTRGHKHGGKKF